MHVCWVCGQVVRNNRPRFMTNLQERKAPYIRLAAHNTGYDMEIGDSPNNLPGYVGVYANEWTRSHSAFWNEYRRLEKIGEGKADES